MQAHNTSYTLHNVEIQNYPVSQEKVLVSVHTLSKKNCVRNTCYRHILKHEEKAKFYDVNETVATMIAYEREVTLIIEGEFTEKAVFSSYDSGILVLSLV